MKFCVRIVASGFFTLLVVANPANSAAFELDCDIRVAGTMGIGSSLHGALQSGSIVFRLDEKLRFGTVFDETTKQLFGKPIPVVIRNRARPETPTGAHTDIAPNRDRKNKRDEQLMLFDWTLFDLPGANGSLRWPVVYTASFLPSSGHLSITAAAQSGHERHTATGKCVRKP